MTRVHISLDESEYRLGKKQAHRLGISFAEFVRRAIRDVLPPESERPWMKYAGMVQTGDPRSSQSIDDTVYSSSLRRLESRRPG